MQQGINIVGVQFRRAGKIYDFAAGSLTLTVGDSVVVDSERGPSMAEVVEVRYHNPKLKLDKKLKPVIRKLTFKEVNRPPRLSADYVTSYTSEKVGQRQLKMRILKSEVQFDGNKVVVYFSAPGRVDFRDLVKDLASGLKTRVELRQVGSRDETKILGGLGICGREYCCSSFLREFVPVSIRMAKNQNLALNPSKVSGGCGRLLCCLTYENDTYTRLRQVLPPLESTVKIISKGIEAKVLKADLLNQLVYVKGEDDQEYKIRVEDIEFSGKHTQQPADDHLTDEKEIEVDQGAKDWAEGLDLESLEAELFYRSEQQSEGKNQDRRGPGGDRPNRPQAPQRDNRPPRDRNGQNRHPRQGNNHNSNNSRNGNRPDGGKNSGRGDGNRR